MLIRVGDCIRIESYKHPHQLHRIWKASTVLKLGEPLIVANYNPEVIESNGFLHTYPGLAICLFSKINWFHPVIIFDSAYQVDQFYVDIASPYQWDQVTRTLSYIDYDLDLIVKPDFSFDWTDEEEYEYHATLYQYPESVRRKVAGAKKQLVRMVENQDGCFSIAFADYWCHQYLSLMKAGRESSRW